MTAKESAHVEKMKAKRFLAIGICIALAIIAGCHYNPPEKKLTKVNITFQEWVGYGPFFLAQEKGFGA